MLNLQVNLEKNGGGKDRVERQMMEFQEAVDCCFLRDLGYKGPKFTWCNKREGSASISERIDRFFANSTWCQKFPLLL